MGQPFDKGRHFGPTRQLSCVYEFIVGGDIGRHAHLGEALKHDQRVVRAAAQRLRASEEEHQGRIPGWTGLYRSPCQVMKRFIVATSGRRERHQAAVMPLRAAEVSRRLELGRSSIQPPGQSGEQHQRNDGHARGHSSLGWRKAVGRRKENRYHRRQEYPRFAAAARRATSAVWSANNEPGLNCGQRSAICPRCFSHTGGSHPVIVSQVPIHRRAERLMLPLTTPPRGLDALHPATALDAEAATLSMANSKFATTESGFREPSMMGSHSMARADSRTTFVRPGHDVSHLQRETFGFTIR